MLTPRGTPLRSRRARDSKLLLPLVAAFVLAAVMAGWIFLRHDPTSSATTSAACTTTSQRTGAATSPSRTPSPVFSPLPPGGINVNVYNATDLSGLAARVGEDLRSRGFAVGAVGNDPQHDKVTRSAEVRHGPDGRLVAQTVAAYVPGAVLVQDKRKGGTVDLVLGDDFTTVESPKAQPSRSVKASSKPPRATTPPASPGC
jgi:hypothetical protein